MSKIRLDAVADVESGFAICCRAVCQQWNAMARRFQRNFRAEPWVKIPEVYWQFSSPSVLTLEYCPGTKISNVSAIKAAGLDTKALAERATESYLIQILKHGFFHADPHP
eukprot:scaffold147277_cov33-Prasinocladus_malaysianus.AAC.2